MFRRGLCLAVKDQTQPVGVLFRDRRQTNGLCGQRLARPVVRHSAQHQAITALLAVCSISCPAASVSDHAVSS